MSSPWDNLPKSFVLEVRSLGLNAGTSASDSAGGESVMTRALTSNGGSRLAMEAAARDAFHAMAGTDQYKLSGQEILGALDAGLLASFESSAPILRVLHRNALLRDAVAAMRDGVTADEWVEVLDWLFDVATMNGLG